MKNGRMNRRQFLGGAATVAAFTIVPRHVLAGSGQTPPSEKLNIACIGIGGQGASDIQSVSSENIVALCDVDWGNHTAKTFEKFPNAKKYKDFRKMLDAEDKNIDAVTVSTPDNIHAVAAMAAIKRGKHVYCEKPLCHDIYEVRQLTEAARKQGVATQMGTQIHGTHEMKLFVEIIQSGVIGKIRKVDLWSGKNWGGGERPTDTPPVPETLDWDLWLGPAPYRPYHPSYVAGQLAAMAGLRDRHPGRHGLPHHRPRVVGAGPGLPDKRGRYAGAVQQRNVPGEDDCDLGVRGQGRPTGHHGELVRR